MFGMPYKRQMRVKDNGKIAGHTLNQLKVEFVGEPFRERTRFDKHSHAGDERQGFHNAGQGFQRLLVMVADDPIQNQFANRPADEGGGDEADEHQGSTFGRVHGISKVVRQGRLKRRILRRHADVPEILRLAHEFQFRRASVRAVGGNGDGGQVIFSVR